MNVQVTPPSADLYSPHWAAPGIRLTPPPTVEFKPRMPRVMPTYRTFGFPGVTAIVPMERPLKGVPSGPVQVSPPSIDLYNPTPAPESALAFDSPVPA